MDELETFVLDFLAYRREQRMKMQPQLNHTPKFIEHKQESSDPTVRREAGYIPPTMGMGWPHYKGTVNNQRRTSRAPANCANQDASHTLHISASQNDIIPALAPVVAQVLSRFGPPTNPKSLDHLINQVVASAMTLPPVNESVKTAEITPWGKVALLQAVIELLIRISTM